MDRNTNTVTLQQIKNTVGVNNIVEKEGKYYINSGSYQVTYIWWEPDGKIRIRRSNGIDSDETLEMIEKLIGCHFCYFDSTVHVANYVKVI